MAATIARATGNDKSRSKETHRLGSESASVEAATWHTSARASVDRHGMGYVQVERDGRPIVRVDFPSEDAPNAGYPAIITVRTPSGRWIDLKLPEA